ncbi:hypothetical protein RJ640_014148 [Escallonia rubra]|uniref:Uncharacterized protein n=1 Tax=Escallonia rubra TaxID=112253 RepID=A0AA88RA78_9ASTE|nr:hypothetical protein RJ640_014148 [Escallonia rubra]
MATSSNEGEVESHISDDIEDPHTPLAISIRKMICSFHPICDDRSICRAPTRLRTLNEKMYTPQNISLGPLHHGKKELATMEKLKPGYLKSFLNRTNMRLDDCISVIKKNKDTARSFYAEELELTDDNFVTLLLVDSCFIIEAIRRGTASDFHEKTDYLSSPELIRGVMTDMILLENQIPFFLLDDLYDIAFKDTKFLQLSMEYFSVLMPDENLKRLGDNVLKCIYGDSKPKHFLDFIRTCHTVGTSRRKPGKEEELFTPIPSAAELKEAGIGFKTGSSDRLLDINYSNGVLKVPIIRVYDRSECVLRNLIALEHCLYPFDSYVTDYINFMNKLIDTSKDVDLLVKKGIIKSGLSDNSAVAALFNNLGMHVTLRSSDYYFHQVSADLNCYYNVRMHKWKATFKRDYCKTPWMIASTVAAIILLALTLIQAICSILILVGKYKNIQKSTTKSK